MSPDRVFGIKDGDDGPGVDADFILYVSAKTTRACLLGTIGYGGHCMQEFALDR